MPVLFVTWGSKKKLETWSNLHKETNFPYIFDILYTKWIFFLVHVFCNLTRFFHIFCQDESSLLCHIWFFMDIITNQKFTTEKSLLRWINPHINYQYYWLHVEKLY